MELKKIAVGSILSFLSTLISFLGFLKALDHGNSMQITAAASGFAIFLSLFVMVLIFILRNHKLFFGESSRK